MSIKFNNYIAWFIVSIFYAYQYILRVMPNIMMTDLMKKFDVGAVGFGQFSGIYYIFYSLAHLPIGIFLDRFSPRIVMSLCILCTSLGLVPLVYADQWLYPILGRALIGVGSSAAILGAFKIIRLSFEEKHFTRMLSISVMIGLMGAIYGGAPVKYLCDQHSTDVVIQIFLLGGLCLAALSYFILPKTTTQHTKTSVFNDLSHILTNKRVLITCISAGLMVGPLEGFADVWATTFLKQYYALDDQIAASLPSSIFLGMCFGAPVLSLLAEKFNAYRGTIIASGLIMASVFILLLLKYLTPTHMFITFALVGVCSAYQIIAIYKASTYVEEHQAGLTTAIANMIIMSFGYAFHSSIGYTVHHLGGITNHRALPLALIIIPVTLLIGSFGFTILGKNKENH
jgi:predicted MFS family arabinose efflux permease